MNKYKSFIFKSSNEAYNSLNNDNNSINSNQIL